MNDPKDRITILLPFFKDGGVERAMLHLAHGFLARGKQVDFVFISDGDGPLATEIPAECRMFALHAGGPLAALPAFVRYLRRERPQAVLAVLTPASLLALWGKMFARIPVRVVLSVQLSVRPKETTSSPFKALLRPLVYKLFYPRADAIVAASNGVGGDLVSFGVPMRKIRTIYNPVVSPETKRRAEEPVDEPWFAAGEPPVVLGVGRLHRQKDFPTLLRAFALVLAKTNARLIILGEGEERAALLSLARELGISDAVKLPGFVSNPYAYMRQAAVFALSSAWEGFGNVVAEALAAGTPVVSTDCPWGPAEILDNGTYGTLVPVGDSQALAEGIVAALATAKDSDRLRAAAERFSFDRATEEYLKALGLS